MKTSIRKLETGTEKLLVEVEEGIARLTFNSPEKHNALSVEMRNALPGALQNLQDDAEVRVIVVTGAGGKAFISGADISEFGEQRTTREARATYDKNMAASARAWTEVDKPIIAMIRGYCIGGGLMTALQTDIRIASEDSQFGVPAARLGLGYGYGGVKGLIDLVGPSWAAEILFSARRLSAQEALQIGLVNRVVSPERIEEEVMGLARTIQTNAPLTIRAVKAAIKEAMRDPERRNLSRVSELVEACFQSEDYLEGQRAFIEKREPRFKGS